MLDLRDLELPVLGAPMAGGPGTPSLAAAVTNAGGLGFLAGGYLDVRRLADDIAAARSKTTGPLGVNLFVPQPSAAITSEIDRYRAELVEFAERYGVSVGEPRSDDDSWAEKLDLVTDVRPDLVSFTFGLPDPAVAARLRAAGITTAATVTSAAEARNAVAVGMDALVVQGPQAGGHRGTLTPRAAPPEQPLPDLLTAVAGAVDIPLIAAGGISTAADVASVLRGGACAAQVGTALLLADEAGTNAVHRAALTGGQFTETVVTRAFSGRYARGLANLFTRRYDPVAPFGYPEVHYMTSPIRRAAVAAGDPDGTSLWAGTGFRSAQALPAAQIVTELGGGLR